MLRTVADYSSARASLEVRCCNCDHTAYFSARFLANRLHSFMPVDRLRFRCCRCQGVQVQLTAASEAAAGERLAEGMHFGGIYDKFQD